MYTNKKICKDVRRSILPADFDVHSNELHHEISNMLGTRCLEEAGEDNSGIANGLV